MNAFLNNVVDLILVTVAIAAIVAVITKAAFRRGKRLEEP